VDRRQETIRTRGLEHEQRRVARLLERLEQRVLCLFNQAIALAHEHDAPASLHGAQREELLDRLFRPVGARRDIPDRDRLEPFARRIDHEHVGMRVDLEALARTARAARRTDAARAHQSRGQALGREKSSDSATSDELERVRETVLARGAPQAVERARVSQRLIEAHVSPRRARRVQLRRPRAFRRP
jgi:hypothetical protein